MAGLSFYTVDERYIDYLAPYAPHLFHNAKKGQGHSRKYIGIVFEVNGFEYFTPLSSFKEKHRRMKNGLDFIKVGDYAVINLNCMFPVATDTYQRVDFSAVQDKRYRACSKPSTGSSSNWRVASARTRRPCTTTRQITETRRRSLPDATIFPSWKEPAKASAIQRTAEATPRQKNRPGYPASNTQVTFWQQSRSALLAWITRCSAGRRQRRRRCRG